MAVNFLVTLRFAGTAYHGSQIQKNARTVQARFQSALEAVLGELPDIKCCSRTDSGVHANMFCISFKSQSDIKPERLVMALNNNLPDDIRVTECRKVDDGFHARYSARAKRYIYKIYNSDIMDPFYAGRAVRFSPRIDEKELNGAAQVFSGRHDFKAFCSKKTDAPDTVRTITDISVTRDGELVTISITADGFLYNMARAISGSLLNVARGKLSKEDIASRLETGVRDNLIATAPAEGLYLDYVFY